MKKILQICVGVLALATALWALLRSFSWQEAVSAINAVRWPFIVTAIALSLTVTFIKATRFFLLLKMSGIAAKLGKTIIAWKASEAFTPLPVGEAGRAIIFHRRLAVPLEKVAAPVFVQGLFEMWSAAAIASIGALAFEERSAAWVVAPAAVLAAMTLPLAFPGKMRTALKWIKDRGIAERSAQRLIDMTEPIEALAKKGLTPAGIRALAWVTALGLLGHAINGIILWQAAAELGADISFPQAAFAAASAALIQGILWVIPGGLGVTEGGLAAILNSFALSWNASAAVTILFRAATLPVTTGLALLTLAVLYLPKIFPFVRRA